MRVKRLIPTLIVGGGILVILANYPNSIVAIIGSVLVMGVAFGFGSFFN